ncbi:MAG TPA: MerC domain-containing protein [Leptospiraceae bacterium]|nr:MerC domain-containing protein [Leptospiraceae bacterium]HMW04993.1 MerC domain-containing protein [Leptospiraceae bacterium]HMX35101.1 MerC domain-containing protein [Leptospiraceae bacterium]HMY30786.1 MerC domain-containing protein [Leptospiraceae bacterium]HMZ66367.1 MerC domain-containing protein [Leptospiraceae bacterium]
MLTSLRKNFENLDSVTAIGIFLSVACAIHCMALPILLFIAPITGFVFFENEILEFFILGISVLITGFNLYSNFKYHKSIQIILLFSLAVILIVFGNFSPEYLKPWMDAFGSFCLSTTLFWNLRLTHSHSEHCSH